MHPRFLYHLFIFIFLTSKMLSGQVYNYFPLHYNDFETNPASLVNDMRHDRLQLYHNQSYATSDPFLHSSLRWSKFLESSFTGIGLGLNHTQQNRKSYSHLTVAGAYRNILFNSLYIKFGAAYKLNALYSSQGGYYDNFFFQSDSSSTAQLTSHNVNISLSLSSTYDRYYISFSRLNNPLPFLKDKNEVFPVNYVMNAGNLMSLFDRNNQSELSWTLLARPLSDNNKSLSLTNYLNVRLGIFRARSYILQMGSRLGYDNAGFLHLAPGLIYHSDLISVSLTQNVYPTIKGFSARYTPNSSINLIYNL